MPRPTSQGKEGAIPANPPGNPVERFVPEAILPYLRLARFDRPIGIYLLAFPCLWSASLAARSIGDPYPDPWLLVLFLIGAIVMRGAGCTYNDIVDRDIDARVARTRTRPLPSGKVTPRAAFLFMVALSLIGLAVLVSFNRFTILIGLGVLPIVALYPFVKRFSHWPQTVLGLAFNWGALMGWAAALDRLDLAPLVLYAGAVCWTIGYDTIYAHQDREDDGLLGVKSTALRFGRATKLWLTVLYAIAWLAITAAGLLAGAGFAFLLGMAAAAGQLAWQVVTLDIDDAENCLARFRSNRDFAAIVLGSILLDMGLAAIF
ncbi:4-hydroxybenzoate octaprenyltransferase [Methyloceanibacter sp.]|uniref:4-hydroxybenzoate octaprenyltransferase n=1 Tax=Methyloceanibacter sp. TaxID=1965321 RepID=UPI002D5A8F0F|nr:4-hydroxybenzoate octaprenyltransferase [Methyloceanibacter sp.]HZP10479.1 4-hydroxybenzoate octaprenyltransferase [Methyloceanibacter sp.]